MKHLQDNNILQPLNKPKNKNTNALYVASVPIAINNITGINLFPDADSPHNFCYLIVDPQRRAVKYWSAAFVDFW